MWGFRKARFFGMLPLSRWYLLVIVGLNAGWRLCTPEWCDRFNLNVPTVRVRLLFKQMKRAALYTLLLLRAAEAATIQGTVVEHVSGRPLARAQVQLTTVGPQGAGGGTETHASSTGQFRFSNLSAGVYLVSAARVGFATSQYGQKDWKTAGLPIFLAERESSVMLELRLRRLGVITGMVWDENQVGLPDQDVVLYEAVHPLRMLTR